jgi:hypothetical protein
MENIDGKIVENLSDFELLKQCEEFGKAAILARQKFIGLLPEVNKRELYKKRGCKSIYEFAAKLAGLSVDQVKRVINLEKKLEDKPIMHEALVNGDVSANKLERVVSVATPENESKILETTKILPQRTLEVWARDLKNESTPNLLSEEKSVHVHELNFHLPDEVVDELNRLNEQGQDMGKILSEFLVWREQKIEQEKQEISKQVEAEPARTRYIPARTRRVVLEEYGKKCSAPGCKKPSMEIHHTLPFAITRRHDPQFMAPLCREHHQIAHLTNLKYAEKLRP